MNQIHFNVSSNYEEMSLAAAKLIIEKFKKKPEGLYCFAAGDTPTRTLQLVVAAHLRGEIDLTRAYYIQLDEWIGLDSHNEGSCIAFLNREFFQPANIPEDHIHVFNALSDDLALECIKANQFIQKHGNISLSLLGVGVNGHLGFNEPGVDFEKEAHVIDLQAITQEVGKKYFKEDTNRSQGITLGIKQLLASEMLIIEANGKRKKDAISKVLNGKINPCWPVTAIWKHENAYLMVDESAIN
ncbi:glucosamine-6-phosphate deaminase [Neobacillus niacini]|uniref:glucosamine-6-phosphate deaminase n=1 Tax=Neobacillus niacini TaxID=86668 RepID=UPI0021CB8E0E|nr:glucosamine-6-phosphate deaminase [Neobacillus niacini]MCM3763891.1 glucosamine-6-phosphate deaminase [Neobacillus niacini]